MATGVVRENNPNFLKEYGRDLVLADKWARGVLEKLTWSKHKVPSGKVDPSPQFLTEEEYTFQRKHISIRFGTRYPLSFIINIDQTPLSDVNTGKYMFSFKGLKNIPKKGVDDKRQITATFVVNCNGEFLLHQLIYAGKSERSLPKYSFPPSF